MVGVVIVSHSQKVAEGIREMALQMSAPEQKIIAAGGMADGGIGTDAFQVSEAIIAANTGDGVAVMVDLGSAVLSTETAFEFLDEELRANVQIADAPILEGAISAVVEASLGSALAAVIATAEGARALKKC
ncbi:MULTISPECIES: dihydroxyacetone kinase phosphoryl donor subunit DhaM [Pelosinus]|uniref:phosphoenolpyruvate--glycerone phosphotransferase n=1 Tax=Pelosinus fermentans B4 TaxID=1149862 RepID=I8RAV1_9FIRM|nr:MULTISPECIES: dihydroxyacetone kinase phosphoryl donor subunit DhaM [Pelosinus]EIW16073.1 dihydroxyacetone kinase, phosphotransfer subunit [Pelosinus fermentans B4]EIW25963.1 dihydroxyacetone kinase, phosphotransfer subunit [Pelosinus fermentans A11]OAM95904.1 dihydroxyacetone kinase, phosphotransfer subunit [Pelosinus fermentans DSM 17108]SDR34151.1 dihydroxyacetone kinase, phosphotransfer subunit [Pelosinus fermentans]